MAPTSIADLVSALPADDSWGPTSSSDNMLNGVPYAPFSKGDKLGRMADWTAESKDRERQGRQQYNRNFRGENQPTPNTLTASPFESWRDAQSQRTHNDFFVGTDQQVYGAGSGSLFTVAAAEDESSFSVVDNTRTSTKRTFGRGGGTVFRGRGGQRGGMAQRGGRGAFQRAGGGRGNDRFYDNRGGGRGRGRRFGWKDYDKPQRTREPSVNVRPEWQMLEEVDFSRLSKLNLEAPEGEDLDTYGFLYYYDRSYDKPPVKNAERRIQALDRAAYNVTTSQDPVIHQLAEKNAATVFATSDILSMLMCATRSVYSWDIVIVHQGDKIYLDKRNGASLDLVTVNENAYDAPLEVAEASGKQEQINTPSALAMEATFINHNFALQTVTESPQAKVAFAQPNPFYNEAEETEPLASKGYKYRRFDIGLERDDEPLQMVVRTEVDAVMKNPTGGLDQQLIVKALNEFDSKAPGSGNALDWRSKLASQRGAVLATEMKNNSCKLARWTTQAILAKADGMKLGFVSRANPRSAAGHVVLGVVGYKPKEFATQMNLNLSNGWGIVRTIVDRIRALDADEPADAVKKYVLIKDPNKSVLRLYSVPATTFDEDEEAELEQEEDKGDESDE
ncbi:Eukaryotic translation initiation factor 3 subunit [Penicillium argentinense]|uniref:Eukaryotic translation initiation factor 3 subunit D n=1 Tax=Penicillium argentinense TaxID=1131581 RepID=A0A9W9JX66_9EURO|nr:Eukaryotic translation initiation factor 3 subunit [Penicillium argentinense]KAJ5085184.1 Eukaryotic translation initiation factor 3 subunit [Penicillium argentinense]